VADSIWNKTGSGGICLSVLARPITEIIHIGEGIKNMFFDIIGLEELGWDDKVDYILLRKETAIAKGGAIMKKKLLMFVAAAVVSVGLCAAVEPMGAYAQTYQVKVVNHSSSPILHVYASNVSAPNWGRDVTGPVTIYFNEYLNIDVNDGSGSCYYDLKAVMLDGRAIESRSVYVCNYPTWTIYDKW